MQLFEVKNDIAKIIYNPAENHLLPSDFLLLEDVNQKLITQILSIETTENSNNNLAVLRLCLSIDKEDNLSYYNGYIPTKTSKIIYINPVEIMELIKGTEASIYFGNLSNHSDCFVKPSMKFLNEKMYILSDRDDKTKTVVSNLIVQLQNKSKKVILLDFDGSYSNIENANVVKISDGFKLPLNIEAFNTILEHDTLDCPLDDKAVIQSIVLELREYLKTLPDKYLPFTMFKNVVDDEFLSNPVSGLMLLRNKLWLYSQDSIFAENKSQFDVIDSLLEEKSTLVIDASSIDEKWYKFIIMTIQSLCNKSSYFILSLNDVNIDKKSIISLYNKDTVIPIISTSYNSEYCKIVKSICKNFVLFKPSCATNIDEPYSVLLNKINADEFLLYGDATLYLPLLLELMKFSPSVVEDIVENDIKRDVDKFFSSNKTVIPQEPVMQLEEVQETVLETEKITEKKEITEQEAITESIVQVEDIPQNKSEVTLPDFDILDEFEFSEVGVSPDEIQDDLNDNDLDFLDETLTKEFESYTPVTTPEDVLETKKYDMFDPLSADFDEINTVSSDNQESDLVEISDVESNHVIELIDSGELQEEDVELEPLMPETVPMSVLLSESYQKSKNKINEKKEIEKKEQDEFEVIEFNELSGMDVVEPISSKENPTQNQVIDTSSDLSDVPSQVQDEAKDFVDEDKEEKNSITNEKDDDEGITPLDDIISNITNKYTERVLNNNFALNQDDENDVDSVENREVEKKLLSKDDIELEIDDSEEIKQKAPVKPPKIKEKINNTKKSKKLTVYETDNSFENIEDSSPFKIGDTVYHQKYGKGIIEGFANYSNKIFFCQVDFENVGRRILDPRSSGLDKI